MDSWTRVGEAEAEEVALAVAALDRMHELEAEHEEVEITAPWASRSHLWELGLRDGGSDAVCFDSVERLVFALEAHYLAEGDDE
jgi:hypothetical protein